jgi:Sec-independent protein translocase protein TatA
MSRHLLFVLLLATGVALADDRPEAQRAAGAAEAQAKTEASQAQTEHVQAQTEEAQGQTEEAQAQKDKDAKLTSVPGAKALGMSILGNQDAPKSLVIVPWKSSELGNSPGISPMLDDSRQPVDKEVFMRALRYYEIMKERKP